MLKAKEVLRSVLEEGEVLEPETFVGEILKSQEKENDERMMEIEKEESDSEHT